MRASIILDDDLATRGLKYAKTRSKSGLIHEALREFVQGRERLYLRELRGRVRFQSGYDYKSLRG